MPRLLMSAIFEDNRTTEKEYTVVQRTDFPDLSNSFPNDNKKQHYEKANFTF